MDGSVNHNEVVVGGNDDDKGQRCIYQVSYRKGVHSRKRRRWRVISAASSGYGCGRINK